MTSKQTGGEAQWVGIATVVMTLVGWSSVPLFLKHFSHSIDHLTSNGWRYGFSALLWAPVVVVALARKKLPPGVWRAAIVPAIFNTVGQFAFAWAHYKISPGLLSFGLRTQIAFVAIGAFMLFPSERRVIRSRPYLVGLAMVFCGAIGTILLSDKGLSNDGGATSWLGVALAIGSGALFAGYGLSVRKCMHGMHPVLAFAVICQYTGAALAAIMFAWGHNAGMDVLRLPDGQIALLLLSAVIGIALGHVVYYISIARLGVAVTAGVIQLQPFLVAAASYFLFREQLKAVQWVSGGVAIIGAGMMLAIQRRLSAPGAPVVTPQNGDLRLDGLDQDAEAAATAGPEAPPPMVADARPRTPPLRGDSLR
ncbi:MAG: DMT family transporter [Phycisphaerales bacterium]|nr:DMT family transporter [Phycisphaerales bacterium]